MFRAKGTLAPDGSKLCPFDKDSTVCKTADCYFYKPLLGTDDRLCPHPNCDLLIFTYCQQDTGNAKGKGGKGGVDFGCQVYTRPPFIADTIVGVGPYIDWLESAPVETVDNQPQTLSAYVAVPGMKGGMNSLEITLSAVGGAVNATKIGEAVADTLSVSRKLVFTTTATVVGGNTALIYQAVGDAIAPAKITTLQGATTLGGETVSSVVAKAVIRSSRCYGNTPAEKCPEDPIYKALRTSRDAMSGVFSVPTAELEKCVGLSCNILPDVVGAAILVTAILAASFFTFSWAQSVAQDS